MSPYQPNVLTGVPNALEKRLEVIESIRALTAPDADARFRRRRDEIAAIRRDLQVLALTVVELQRACDPRLRSYVLKYNPDQPRMPAGNPQGGQWTSEGGDANDASSSDGAQTNGSSDVAGDPSDGVGDRDPQYAAADNGIQTDATPAVPSDPQTPARSSGSSQQLSGDVIRICVLLPGPSPTGTCRYWCHSGFVLDKQRNLGLACPSIVLEPG